MKPFTRPPINADVFLSEPKHVPKVGASRADVKENLDRIVTSCFLLLLLYILIHFRANRVGKSRSKCFKASFTGLIREKTRRAIELILLKRWRYVT